MKIATVTLRSDSPMAQGRYHETPKEPKELANDYEKRTWANKMHITEDGNVFIPPMALKNCLSEAAKFTSMQIPGKGKSTYTKHFEAGVLCKDRIVLATLAKDVQPLWLFVPASGIRGDSKRVMKAFPVIPEWQGTTKLYVTDDIITEDVLHEHLLMAGQFIGLGSLRVRNNGYFGMFTPIDMKWESV